MNHLGSSDWIGDSDANTTRADMPPDLGCDGTGLVERDRWSANPTYEDCPGCEHPDCPKRPR